MKIAKKFMTLALAAALGVGCATVGVGAAPSNTSDLAAVAPSRTSETTVDSEHSSIYEVVKELEKTQGFADLQAKYKDLADAFKQINDGTMKMEDFINFLLRFYKLYARGGISPGILLLPQNGWECRRMSTPKTGIFDGSWGSQQQNIFVNQRKINSESLFLRSGVILG